MQKSPLLIVSAITWEQRKLKDTFDFLQNNTLSRADLSLDSGVAKDIHYGDVLIKFGEYLDATKTALPFITSQQIAEKYKGSILQDGDIIMADTAEDETVGKCTEIVNLQGFPAISGLHTIPLRPKDNFATGFLGYYMNSEAYHNQLLPLMQGIKVTWQLVSQFSGLLKGLPADKPIFVGNKRVYNSTANDILSRHCRAVNIPVISVHGLRHTHASLLLFAGVSIASVARRLGHSSMTTTQKTYLHIIQELENKDVAASLNISASPA